VADDGERYVCELCRVEVKPDDLDVVAYATQITTDTFGGRETTDGLRALFHMRCAPSPANSRWRRVPKE
jgi:hypothetical protein